MKTPVLLLLLAALLASVPLHAHPDHSMGESSWFFGNGRLVARIELSVGMMTRVDAAPIETPAARLVLQRYLERKLTVIVNDRPCPVVVTRVGRGGHAGFAAIWLSVEGAAFDRPLNTVTIDYRLLFDETRNAHLNSASVYVGDEEPRVQEQRSRPTRQFTFSSDATALELSIPRASGAASP